MTKTPEIWSPDYWLSRAQEMREAARALHYTEDKKTLLRIAQLYEEVAAGRAPASGLCAAGAKKADASSDSQH